MKLCNANLPKFSGVKIPQYDRSGLKPGIVHIGLGNFHRAHQSWYLSQLMAQGLAQDWAIVGAGVRPYDKQMREKFIAQDYLTTLIELDPKGKSAEIVGSMIDYVPVEAGNAPLIAKLAEPEIRIVSMTVTEGGYYIDPATQGFDSAHPDMQHDAAHPEAPITAFGAIIAALKKRRDNRIPAFTCQSCDNLQGNGDIFKQTILSLAGLSDPALAEWIAENSTFPNSMVDCIVPATGPKELALVKTFGIDDAVPVTHENFRQWVIQDNFALGRPPWEQAGATITDDVDSYERMKIRILNGGHQVIAATGDLLGIEIISETIKHPLIQALFEKVEHEEIMPHIEAVPEYTPEAYIELINQRLHNTAIVDTTKRVAFDGSSRQPGFVLPSVFECLEKNMSVNGLALVSAIWARYCLGVREDGSKIEANDPYWEELLVRAQQARENPITWIQYKIIYASLAEEPRFAEPFVKWLTHIYDKGLESALKTYVEA